jgi:molybdopterin converting factor small subunit
MKVKITYFGPIRYFVGLDEEWIELDGVKSTVEELLAQLSAKHSNVFLPISSDGSPRFRDLNIFINGKHILEFEKRSTVIQDDIEVSIVLVSQAAGG